MLGCNLHFQVCVSIPLASSLSRLPIAASMRTVGDVLDQVGSVVHPHL